MDGQNPRTNGESKATKTKSHTEAYTYTLTKRGKGEKIIYLAPKVHLLNLGWFVVYSGIPQTQGTSWLWSFNLLLLRLLGEISLSLLCLHSSRGSASSPAHPDGWADKPLGLVSAGQHCSSVREPLPLCPPHPCGCALLRGSEAPRLHHPQSPPRKGLPSVWKPFLLHSSLPLVLWLWSFPPPPPAVSACEGAS